MSDKALLDAANAAWAFLGTLDQDDAAPTNDAIAAVEAQLKAAIEGAASEPWTEQQERLLRAAQDVVNDSGVLRNVEPGGGYSDERWIVSKDSLDALKAVVQEISDDVVKLIEGGGK